MKAPITKNCKKNKQIACSTKKGLSHINKIQIKIKILVKRQKPIERPPNWKLKPKFIKLRSVL